MTLKHKKGLIFGVANKNSIAWGIAQALHADGAELGFTYANDRLERRVRPLAESVNSHFIEECDVTNESALERTFAKAKSAFGDIDFLAHCIAYAPREDLSGCFRDTSRDGFQVALDVSCYSLIAMSRLASELMPNGGSIIAMTYFGSEKVTPNYNVMGVAKAALEASVRYLAWDLGNENIRVNAISAGPIRTLSASGIAGFRKSLDYIGQVAPGGTVSQDDIGNTARFLVSDYATGITGEILHVDGGYNIMGAPDDSVIASLSVKASD